MKVIVPLVLLGIAAASWALRPASRRLDAAPGEPAGWSVMSSSIERTRASSNLIE